MLFSYPQQINDHKQDLIARLTDLLVKLDSIDHQDIHSPRSPASRGDLPRFSRITSYAVENLTNLINGINNYRHDGCVADLRYDLQLSGDR